MDVIDKVKALKRLAENKSATPAEAASAAARVQELMLKHKLSDDQICDENEGVEWWPEPLWVGKNRSPWRSVLAIGIAQANACRVLHGVLPMGPRRLTIVGKKGDAEVVRHLYAYLEREIERHCKAFLAKTAETPTSARLRAASFRIGFAETVSRRLAEERARAKAEAENHGKSTGLIRLDRDEADIQRWVETKGLNTTKPRTTMVDAEAWRQGCERGAAVAIRSAIAG